MAALPVLRAVLMSGRLSDADAQRPKDACPRCGKSVSLSFWNLLPSSDRKRVLACRACGGHFDLTDRCKMIGIMSGMAGMALGMTFPFQWIVKAGHASKPSIVLAVAVAMVAVLGAAAAGARLALSLEPKP